MNKITTKKRSWSQILSQSGSKNGIKRVAKIMEYKDKIKIFVKLKSKLPLILLISYRFSKDIAKIIKLKNIFPWYIATNIKENKIVPVIKRFINFIMRHIFDAYFDSSIKS